MHGLTPTAPREVRGKVFVRLVYDMPDADDPFAPPGAGLAFLRIARNGERRAYGFPESECHTVCSHGDVVDPAALTARATSIAEALFGSDGYTQSEVHTLADVLLNNLDELIRAKPAPMETAKQFENRLERNGVVLEVDGKKVIDAG